MDISKLKLGNTTYNVKDLSAFKDAALTTTTQNINGSNVEFSEIAFYNDANTKVDGVALNNIVIPTMLAYNLGSNSFTMLGSNDISATMTLGLESSKPVISIASSTNGITSGNEAGTATTIKIPVGKSGTVALLDDIPSGATKFGYINRTTDIVDGITVTSYGFYTDSESNQELAYIDLNDIQTSNIETNSISSTDVVTKKVKFNDQVLTSASPQEAGNRADSDNTYIYATGSSSGQAPADKYIFTYGTSSGVTATVTLPMSANGTIALTSDLTALSNAIASINAVLDLEGEDVTTTIDTFNEVKNFLEDYDNSDSLASLLSGISSSLGDYILKTDIADDLSTNDATKVLSAKQGKALNDAISGKLVVYSSGSNSWDTSPTSGSTKPVTSGGIYTAIQNSAAASVSDVAYNSSTRVISKTKNGTTTNLVTLPTATYDSATETLELVLASVPS